MANISRRNFLKGIGAVTLAVGLNGIPTMSRANGKSASELEATLNKEFGKIQNNPKANKIDSAWYAVASRDGKGPNVLLLSDVHNYSQAGLYNNVFDIIKGNVNSFGLESCEYNAKDPRQSCVELANIPLTPFGLKNMSLGSLYEKILASNMDLYGIEKKELHSSHHCLLAAQELLRSLYNDGASFNKVTASEKIINKLYEIANDSRIPELPELSSLTWNRDKFRDYYNKLDKMSNELLDDRSEYAIGAILNKLKETGTDTGVSYGAAHLPLVKSRLKEKGVPYVYVGNSIIEKENGIGTEERKS